MGAVESKVSRQPTGCRELPLPLHSVSTPDAFINVRTLPMIRLEFSQDVLKGLITFKRNDLSPEDDSIQRACELHPWLAEVLEALHAAAGEVQKTLETELLLEAIFTIEKEP